MVIHPGALAALRRLSADELDLAQMMAAGDLVSPQHYHNVWLYCIRITGTGVSYRPQLNEFVFRRPENYLTPEFLARCSGLPVIMLHPEERVLNSEEFGNRVIGTVMLPYIQGDEVWAVAKLYDAAAIEMLQTEQMSTSPGVIVGKDSIRMELADGSKLLIEGKPALLDHICLCKLGVWDKGGDPTGVDQFSVSDARGDAVTERRSSQVEKLDQLVDFTTKLSNRASSFNNRVIHLHNQRRLRSF